MRTIVFLVLLVVITEGAVGEIIYTNEPVVVEDNQATAATLRLNTTGDFNISDMMPGTNRSATVSIENLGSTNGTFTMNITGIYGPENDLLDSETGDDNETDLGCDPWPGYGELDNLVNVTFWLKANNTVISKELTKGELFSYNLLPGETIEIEMLASWPFSLPPCISDNSGQTDSINGTINWRIENGFSDSRTTEFAITAGIWEEEK